MRRLMNMADIPTGAEVLRVPVFGNCLEGAAIFDGDSVGIALDHFPRPPKYGLWGVEREDFCLCQRLDKPGPLLLKRYDGRVFGQDHAGTRYRKGPDQQPEDVSFPVEVLGVVIALWDKSGTPVWHRPPESFPESPEPGGEIPFHNVSPVKEPHLLEQATAQDKT